MGEETIYSTKALELTNQGKYEEALELLETIEKEHPENFSPDLNSSILRSVISLLLRNYALRLAKEKDYKDAIKTIARILDLKSDSLNEIHDIFGEILMLSGNYKDAIIQLEKSCSQPPTPIETYFNLAICYCKIYQFHNALPNVNTVLRLIDDDSNFRKYSTNKEFREKKQYITREIEHMKKSLDWLFI